MEVFVARQPILTVENDVYAYEILYRNSEENRFVPMNGNQATSEVLMNSFLTIGLERLSENKPCFINFTEDLLLEKVPEYFNPEQLFVEVLEHVSFSVDIIKVCRGLKEKGYKIALDDFIAINQPSLFEMLHYIDILKVDIRAVQDDDREKIIQLSEEYGLTLLAEKVETCEEHQRCVAEGFTLFQGFYFSKPVIVKGLDIPFFSPVYFQMIKELSISEDKINYEKVTELLEQDIGLTYKLLRLINSSQQWTKVPIHSIKQAVRLFGTESLKKWLYVLSIEHTSTIRSTQSQLVIKASLVRAKMCEQIAVRIRAKEKSDGYFLTGFLSLVDVMTQRPVNEVIEALPLDEGIKRSLQGCDHGYRQVLDLAIGMEKADFDSLEANLNNYHLSFSEVFEIYGQAITWAEQLYDDYFKMKVEG